MPIDQQQIDEWWPGFVPRPTEDDAREGDHLTVAEIGCPPGEWTHLQLFTALVEPELAGRLLKKRGGIGFEVSANGPHPGITAEGLPGSYVPRFWVFGGELAPEGLEPLVCSWESGNQTVLALDQGFLMTYGLVLRVAEAKEPRLCWDDLGSPRYDVVVSVPVFAPSDPPAPFARIRVLREYLQDYASIRGKTLIQVFYAQGAGNPDEVSLQLLGDEDQQTVERPGLEITFGRHYRYGFLFARAWGLQKLMDPGEAPVTVGRWDYGRLKWPGLETAMTSSHDAPFMGFVYVRDEVLSEYEGQDEYNIHPESGSVNYRHQWGVSHCTRI